MKGKEDFGKIEDSSLGQETSKINLECLLIPDREEVIKLLKLCPMDRGANLKRLPLAKVGQFELQ